MEKTSCILIFLILIGLIITAGCFRNDTVPKNPTTVPTIVITVQPTFTQQKLVAATIIPTITTMSVSGNSEICKCSGNLYNCPDFSLHAEAQACYNYCKSKGYGDVHKLDANKDGNACETD